MSRRAIDLLLVVALAIPCFAGDREFKSVVNTVETQYGVHQMHIPFLGFATFCLKAARTPGTSGLKIAVFQHMPRPRGSSDLEFEQKISSTLGPEWKPFVRVRSHEGGGFTIVYANASEKDLTMMIVSLQSEEATVVQAKLKSSDLKHWIDDPEGMAGEHDHDGDQ